MQFFTHARSSVWRHGVAVFRTSTLVTAWNVHTLVRAQMASALGTLVNVWVGKKKKHICIMHIKLINKYALHMIFVLCNGACPTFAGVTVFLEEVALSAVALVRTVDVGTLLTACFGQTLVHIWRLEVEAHYCYRCLDQRIFYVFILTYK